MCQCVLHRYTDSLRRSGAFSGLRTGKEKFTLKFHTKGVGNGVLVVHLEGKLNMVNAPHLRDLINSHVDAGDNRISIDLTNVDFIDSSGLGALINALKVVRQVGGDLRIAAPTEQVKLVLGLTNLDRVLKIYPEAETAFNE